MWICWITPSMFVHSGEASAVQEDSERKLKRIKAHEVHQGKPVGVKKEVYPDRPQIADCKIEDLLRQA